MDLKLDHVATLTELITPLNVIIILALLVFALLTLIFTHKWWGLIAGALILAAALTFGGWLGLQIRDSLSAGASTRTLTGNSTKVQTWATDRYKLNFTTAQAKTLATGTETFTPGNGDQTFGTVPNITVQVSGGGIVVPVTLVYNNHTYVLAYTTVGSDKYVKVPTP